MADIHEADSFDARENRPDIQKSNRIVQLLKSIDDFFIDGKGTLWAAILIVGCLGIYFAHRPKAVTYPPNPASPEYYRNMNRLGLAVARVPGGPPRSTMTSLIPIQDEADLPLLAQKLNLDFRRASDGRLLLSQTFVLGGTNIYAIDDVLLKATKGIRFNRGLLQNNNPATTIVLVSPTRVSEQTQNTLHQRGFTVLMVP